MLFKGFCLKKCKAGERPITGRSISPLIKITQILVNILITTRSVHHSGLLLIEAKPVSLGLSTARAAKNWQLIDTFWRKSQIKGAGERAK
jgi:hypothetical protein